MLNQGRGTSSMANLSNREESNQSLSRWLQVSLGVLILCTMFGGCRVRPLRVSFAHSATTIEAYDFVEVTASVSWPHAINSVSSVRPSKAGSKPPTAVYDGR